MPGGGETPRPLLGNLSTWKRARSEFPVTCGTERVCLSHDYSSTVLSCAHVAVARRGEVRPDEPQGFHTDRAADRGRDHRHFGRDRDSEVREHEGEGLSGFDEVGSA